ncbi:hypothetical protein I4U23_028587 [Adineta vaga]|nr:hypothetical protein I4U23_028587 [Adineta vaga]
MSRSLVNQSNTRIGVELNNHSTTSHHRKSMPNLFKNYRSTKKQLSAILNKADFEICQAPNENEMLEFMQCPNGDNISANNQSDITTSDDTITEREDQNSFNTSPPIPNRSRIISNIKHCLAPYRNEVTKKDGHNADKNRGFLLIDQLDSDLVLIPGDNNDQQHTRHAEPCAHEYVEEDTLDVNQIHLLSTTPATPSLLPPQQPTLNSSSILPIMHHSNSDSDVQATRAGVECAAPTCDETNVQDTQASATNSSTSTNSSNNDPQHTHMDRTILNDIDYVIEQKRDLERITVYEIALNNDRRDYQQDLPQNENDEIDFNLRYRDEMELNSQLKKELKRLQEETDRIYSPWSCEVCTYINEPYIKTRKYVCEMCEGPSPLKRHTLTN